MASKLGYGLDAVSKKFVLKLHNIFLFLVLPAASVEEYTRIYFTPPKGIGDFITLRSILSGYGATIGYEYVYPQKNFFRTKLYVSAPRSKKHIVGELVRRFWDHIREKEVLHYS